MTVKIQVKGRVQGVYYRVTTRNHARELGLTGIVKNENDGSVSIIVSGQEDLIKDLFEWCNTGVKLARVDDITYELIENREFASFEIVT